MRLAHFDAAILKLCKNAQKWYTNLYDATIAQSVHS